MTSKGRRERRRMEGYIHHLMNAADLAYDKETAKMLRKLLVDAPCEKRIVVGHGGTIIKVKVIEGHIATVKVMGKVPDRPAWIHQTLGVGKEFTSALQQLKARKEGATILLV